MDLEPARPRALALPVGAQRAALLRADARPVQVLQLSQEIMRWCYIYNVFSRRELSGSVEDPDPVCHFDADADPSFHIKSRNLEKDSNIPYLHFGLSSAN